MDVLNFPKLDKYINDFSSVLSNSESNTINEALAQHERSTWEQVVIVLFPNRKWFELIDIWLKIFNENGIGKNGLNNGLLLIIATEEKKLRIITGKGMEIKYSEMRCRDIIENKLRPLLNKGKYKELTSQWIEEIAQLNPSTSTELPINTKDSYIVTINTIIIFLFWSVFFTIFKHEIKSICIIGVFFTLMTYMMVISNYRKKRIGKTIALSICVISPLLFLLMGAWSYFNPPRCTPDNLCTRTIFWTDYVYTIWWSSSSSDWFSSSQGSSSSFGGGGGSSNGGGYWD